MKENGMGRRKQEVIEAGKAFLPPRWGCHTRDHNVLFLVDGVHHTEKAGPERAADHSQGIHPLENRSKKTPSPNGVTEKKFTRLTMKTKLQKGQKS